MQTRFSLPQLDGLRFFAFLGVFVFHSLPTTAESWRKMAPPGVSDVLARVVTAGHMGVELFFVLSSFLITELLLRERERSGTVDVPAFWMRRILRIWPLYFAVLALAGVLTWAQLPGHRLTVEAFAWFGLFAGNWYLYLYGFPSSFASVLWTVSIEEQFYLTWPLLMRRVGPRLLAAAGVLLVIGASVMRARLLGQGATPVQLAAHTLCRVDAIGAGALLAVLLHGQRWRRRDRFAGWVMLSGGLLGLGVASASHGEPWLRALPAAAFGAALLVAAVVTSTAAHGVLTNPVTTYLGRISYGLYALHTLVLVTLAAAPFPRSAPGRLLQWGLAFATTIALASLSYHWLERPFLRLKERWGALSRPA